MSDRRAFYALSLLLISQGAAVAAVVADRMVLALVFVVVGGVGVLALLTDWSER